MKLEEKSQVVREIKAPTGCPLCEFQDSLTYRVNTRLFIIIDTKKILRRKISKKNLKANIYIYI